MTRHKKNFPNTSCCSDSTQRDLPKHFDSTQLNFQKKSHNSDPPQQDFQEQSPHSDSPWQDFQSLITATHCDKTLHRSLVVATYHLNSKDTFKKNLRRWRRRGSRISRLVPTEEGGQSNRGRVQLAYQPSTDTWRQEVSTA